jgi:hypothetical protein
MYSIGKRLPLRCLSPPRLQPVPPPLFHFSFPLFFPPKPPLSFFIYIFSLLLYIYILSIRKDVAFNRQLALEVTGVDLGAYRDALASVAAILKIQCAFLPPILSYS